MTKKEKAAFDAAIQRANTLSALRWTEHVQKDLPIPKPFAGNTVGFDFNTYGCNVRQMWSSSVTHGDGVEKHNGCASQGGRPLFSTKLLALRALRHAVECESAEKLRKIDDAIADEILFTSKPTP